MSRRIPLLVAALGCLLGTACRQSVPENLDAGETIVRAGLGQRLDSVLSRAVDSGFSGSVLIAHHGDLILRKGYGFTDAARTRPVTSETRFWLASISKQFAAAAVLKLMEQGRLSVDDSIGRFFADVPPDKRAITVHQLLTHTAGLVQRYAADGIADRAAAVHSILSQPLGGVPGAGFDYSNDAYTLVAAIVEIAARQPYEAYLGEQLLAPAGMTRTGFWGPLDHPDVAEILGQISDSSMLRPNWGYRGAVGMFSTAGDLYRWLVALESGAVLTAASHRRLLTGYVSRGETRVGYGWFTSRTVRGTAAVWTRGFEGFGHGAVLATYPDDQLVVVVTTNAGQWNNFPMSHRVAQEIEAAALR